MMSEEAQQKLDNFFSEYRILKYGSGQILILNGDSTEYVYHLVIGKVKQYDVSYRGDEVILNVFKPPAFFPMSLAINGGVSDYIYEAESDIEVHKIPNTEMIDFLKTNPLIIYDLLSRVYKGLDGMLGRLSQLMASSAKSRLMYELVLEARRFGRLQTDSSVVIDLNEREVGARAGLSRETVSRQMQKLLKSGLVSQKSGTLRINNLSEFENALRETA